MRPNGTMMPRKKREAPIPSVNAFDRYLDRLGRAGILALAVCGVAMVGGVDYLSGYEVSMSLFYLGPVALAAWYSGGWTGAAIAVISCVGWFMADMAAGHPYSHPAIPVWNALIRFGFFIITGSLVTALRRSLLIHRHLARTDGLTGLYGRREFEDRLRHDLALAQRRKSPVTLAYVDVDDFKSVNDTHGHAGGDRVLRAIGRALKRSIRGTDTAARLGGDEFALLLPDTDSRGAQQIISNLERQLHGALGANRFVVTCSIGVATILDAAMSPESAVAAADKLMYEVKRKGKGAVAFNVLGEAVQTRAAGEAPQAARP
jgi:diguanylate cyclase (GGDEF)-like protein